MSRCCHIWVRLTLAIEASISELNDGGWGAELYTPGLSPDPPVDCLVTVSCILWTPSNNFLVIEEPAVVERGAFLEEAWVNLPLNWVEANNDNKRATDKVNNDLVRIV